MARSAFLLANDVAQLVRREQIAGVLGVDQLSRLGMARWTDGVMAVYGTGIFATASGQA